MKILYCILLFSSFIFSQSDSLKDEALICGSRYESLPEPIGGLDSIQVRLIYPSDAVKNNIEGKVYVVAVIDSLGKIVSTYIMKGIGHGCDEEALRLINTTAFKPAIKKGKPEKATIMIPIKFKLE